MGYVNGTLPWVVEEIEATVHTCSAELNNISFFGLMRLNFSKNIRMVRSEYGINMNAWIHPADHFHPFMTINKNVLHCSSPHCKVHHEILTKVWLKMQVFRLCQAHVFVSYLSSKLHLLVWSQELPNQSRQTLLYYFYSQPPARDVPNVAGRRSYAWFLHLYFPAVNICPLSPEWHVWALL